VKPDGTCHSVFPEHTRRVDAGSSARGNPAGHCSDERQHQRQTERYRIAGLQAVQRNNFVSTGHCLPEHTEVIATPILGELHHEYCFARRAA
jgi:hypothetical protein